MDAAAIPQSASRHRRGIPNMASENAIVVPARPDIRVSTANQPEK
jgi:hypothetical protein